MTIKKFLTSVANVYGYDDSTGTVLFIGKTLLDSSLDVKTANTDVRAGQGAQLQYVFYHTAEMALTVTDAQWNLDFISKTVGSGIQTGDNIYTEETVTLTTGGAGTVVGTPLAVSGTTIYGWVTQLDGTVDKVTFSGKTFPSSSGTSGDSVCVRYYAFDAAARSVTVDANLIPSIVHLVLEAQLNSSDSVTNKIGVIQIDIPKATLTGAFQIKMTPESVASTPLAARALANSTSVGGCANKPYYATIKEIVSNANWYDDVIAIGIEGGDFALTNPSNTHYVRVWAVPTTGLPFLAPTSGTELTFSSGTTTTATIGANTGLVTTVASGTTLIHVAITAKPTLDADVTLTVS